jgi:hypothetical protein
MDDMWDQPRMAAAFGVALSTVQSGWRHNTIRALRAHLGACVAGRSDGAAVYEAVGSLERLTAGRWAEVRELFGLPPLVLPPSALPLPDWTIGGRTRLWAESTVRTWAADTERVDARGRFRRASPPGRPPGVAETRPRSPRRLVA